MGTVGGFASLRPSGTSADPARFVSLTGRGGGIIAAVFSLRRRSTFSSRRVCSPSFSFAHRWETSPTWRCGRFQQSGQDRTTRGSSASSGIARLISQQRGSVGSIQSNPPRRFKNRVHAQNPFLKNIFLFFSGILVQNVIKRTRSPGGGFKEIK